MLMVNMAAIPCSVGMTGLMVPAGGTVEIETGYCRPGIALNGGRAPSIIERLSPTLAPADPELRTAWQTSQEAFDAYAMAPVAVSEPTPDLPPAVAALVAADAVEAPKARRKPGPKPKVQE